MQYLSNNTEITSIRNININEEENFIAGISD